jgi:hypothetical protein
VLDAHYQKFVVDHEENIKSLQTSHIDDAKTKASEGEKTETENEDGEGEGEGYSDEVRAAALNSLNSMAEDPDY